jgi:flagellar basal body-associated protein FliL
MENKIQANENEPKKKKMNDFVVLALAAVAFVAALMLLKYVMGAFHVI